MERRTFFIQSGKAICTICMTMAAMPGRAPDTSPASRRNASVVPDPAPVTLFLAGDVMTGRGIDQILPHSVEPRLHEAYVKDARRYVELAEEKYGPIPGEVSFRYVWGDTLDELERVDPHARVINLETSVTTSDDWWEEKEIHYRMHPANVPVLAAANIDVAVLGNNHVLDWGRVGHRETLEALQAAGLATPGAGVDTEAAAKPAVLDLDVGRVLVFAYGTPSAGVPLHWRPGPDRAGVNVLAELGRRSAERVAADVKAHRREGDRVIVSIHWGGNWGYRVPSEQRAFAHRLVDAGAADVIFGHSAHHPKGIEVYHDRPILYGAGDFLNDYEGISGREEYRGDLTLMYFPTIDAAGALVAFEMTPMRIRHFRLERASEKEAEWLAERLDRESRELGARVALTPENQLVLQWK